VDWVEWCCDLLGLVSVRLIQIEWRSSLSKQEPSKDKTHLRKAIDQAQTLQPMTKHGLDAVVDSIEVLTTLNGE
jgi:hypothetical protein